MPNTRTIAVLTDMHFAGTKDGEGKTHVILTEHRVKKQDPLGDLQDLIQNDGLTADAVLCGGDITLGACQSGLVSAWKFVNELGTLLKTDMIVATTGNHDVASRDMKSTPEIWENLKRLVPAYPFSNATELQQMMYWGAHFMVAENDWLRVVTLNTCNSHARGELEFNHGRITDYIIEQLTEKVTKPTAALVNILLCHHHPAKHAALSQSNEDYSEMAHGAKLIETLKDHDSDWMIVHGHKHSPKLHYAQGSTGSPTIVSAGSFSATLLSTYFPTATNQFYLIDFDLDQMSSLGQVGTIRAWDWIKSTGWVPAYYDAQRRDRIVTGSGFGFRVNAPQYSGQIAKAFGTTPIISWSDVLTKFPELRFVLPDEIMDLLRELRTKHGIEAVENDPINPVQLVRS